MTESIKNIIEWWENSTGTPLDMNESTAFKFSLVLSRTMPALKTCIEALERYADEYELNNTAKDALKSIGWES